MFLLVLRAWCIWTVTGWLGTNHWASGHPIYLYCTEHYTVQCTLHWSVHCAVNCFVQLSLPRPPFGSLSWIISCWILPSPLLLPVIELYTILFNDVISIQLVLLIVHCIIHCAVHCTLHFTLHKCQRFWLSRPNSGGTIPFLPLVHSCWTLYHTI